MLEIVFAFAAINILFEMILISMISPKWRLRLLGSAPLSAAMHVAFLIANLAVHWGTLSGSMASILAFVASIVTVAFARKLWGTIKDGRFYTTGWIRYSRQELV